MSIFYLLAYRSNFGKLNWYLGAAAEEDGRPAKYPQVDFCKFDNSSCLPLLQPTAFSLIFSSRKN